MAEHLDRPRPSEEQPNKSQSAGQLIRDWLNCQEDTLRAEAKLAGLLGHSSMIGNAREFLVSKMLRSILPPSVHIGTGRVIDSAGQVSNQVDIILYDSRFPVFEIQPGIGLYPVEGALATIEVKSLLTHEKLIDALENCFSVTVLSPTANPNDLHDALIDNLPRGGSFPDRELEFLVPHVGPAAYVFSFDSRIKGSETLCAHVEDWWKRKSIPSGKRQLLPRVLVGGEVLGLAMDGPIPIRPDNSTMEQAEQRYGPNASVLMSFWPTRRRFGWFAMHVLFQVGYRIGQVDSGSKVRFDMTRYLPAQEFYDADLDGLEPEWFGWAPGPSE